MKNILSNNQLKISVVKNDDLSLADIKRDKNTGDMVGLTIVIYADKLNLPSDVVNLLIERAIFRKQTSSVDELIRLTTKTASYCADEFKKLNGKKSR